MPKLLLIIFLLLLPFYVLFAQEEEEWYLGKPIADIKISGLDTVSESELLPLVRPYIGENFDLDIFWEMQGKLYALDYFEEIQSNALPGDEEKTSVIIEFLVTEKPTVSKIEIKGAHHLRKGEILDTILLKKGDMVSQAKVDLDSDAINELYIQKGFMSAQVSGKVEKVDEDNTVRVSFEIIEGSQTTIKEISFSGNSFASDSTLRKEMKTKAQALFAKGIFRESRLEEDTLRIQDYYGENGFIDARVVKIDRTEEKDPEKDKNYLLLTLFIEEGEQYTYGGMQFEGNSIFSDEGLNKLLRQKEGSILNKLKLEADFQRVTDLYYENGYIFNIIDRQELRDEAKKDIVYLVRIIEKDRAHIENIILKGNEKTKDFVIYRELPFEVGDIFNKGKIIQGLRNLYNLQYFTAITPETPQGSEEGLMDLVINVEEGSTASINFGIMFSGGDYPINGMIKWTESNWRGRGQTFGLEMELSTLRQMGSVSFREPWMFGTRWSGGVNFSLEHAIVPNIYQDILYPVGTGYEEEAFPDPYTSWEQYQEALANGETPGPEYNMEYTSWKVTTGINTGYRYYTPLGWLGIRSGFSTSLELLTYDETLYRPFDPEVRAGLDNWSIVNRLGNTLYWDKRDYFLNPTKGFYLAQGLSFTGGFLFGDRHYIRTDSTAEGFMTLLDLPIFTNWNLKVVLAAHTSLSLILPQFGEENPITVPTDLLYIDGMNIARGWPLLKEQEAVWDNRLELRIPIAEQFLWWAFFFDAATSWDKQDDMSDTSIENFYFSLGGGIRFTIPQFPIRLYMARRFQIQDGKWHWIDGNMPFFGLKLDFVISLGGDTF
jgi:outer membrane protein insertion porin family